MRTRTPPNHRVSEGSGVFGFLLRVVGFLRVQSLTRFLSGPFIIRVPFFLIFSFNKGTRK